jgi:hypothetical protein
MMSSLFVGILTIPTRSRSNPPAPLPDAIDESVVPLAAAGS